MKGLQGDRDYYQNLVRELNSENEKLTIEAKELHLKFYKEGMEARKLKRENEDLNSEIERLRKKQSEIIKVATEKINLLNKRIQTKDEELERINEEKAYLDQILSGKVKLQDDRLEERDFSDTKAKIKRDLQIVYIYSQGLTITDTAKVVGLNRSTVSRILKKYREMEPLKESEIREKYSLNDTDIKKMAENRVKKYKYDQIQNIDLDELKLWVLLCERGFYEYWKWI